MEHSLAPSLDVVRPWRTATIIASAVAAIELVALIAVGIVMLGKPVASHVRTAASEKVFAPEKPERAKAKPKRKTAPLPAPELSRAQTTVLVLNGNGVTGAAAAASARVRAAGYLVGSVGNAPRSNYTRSLVMYRPGFAPEARRLARDLHLRIVGPLDGLRKKQLMGAHVALVLGSGR